MKVRNYGIDLLRIVSMFMIVVGHICYQGGIIGASKNSTAFWLVEIMCFCAVNCYGFISGYVGVKSNSNKYNRFIELWLRTVFYCLTITLIMSIVVHGDIVRRDWLAAVTPILSGEYWYLTAYFVVVLFSPILNFTINHMDRNKARITVLLFIVVFTILPLFKNGDVFKMTYGYSGWWLMILYFIGGYCSKYAVLKKLNKSFSFLLYVLPSMLAWGLTVLLKVGTSSANPFGRANAVAYFSIFMFLAAVGLVSLFEKMEFKNRAKAIIKIMSPHAFSVYLIHANPLIIKYCIEGSFVWISSIPFPAALFFTIIASLLVYLGCTLIDIPVGLFFLKIKIYDKMLAVERKVSPLISRVLAK